MFLENWENLPEYMKNEGVKKYYIILKHKTPTLFLKRTFDIIFSLFLIVLLFPLLLIIGLAVKLDSPGPILFLQERVTQYGRIFKLFKFRSMVDNAQNIGPSVTTCGDSRVTRVGKIIRKLRLDETPQLFNILIGDLTFVGTRPEVKKYVDCYTDEMMATLLLPAGVTSMTSVAYRDEEKFLSSEQNVDDAYVKILLPAKMNINLEYIKNISVFYDLKVVFVTVFTVFGEFLLKLRSNKN